MLPKAPGGPTQGFTDKAKMPTAKSANLKHGSQLRAHSCECPRHDTACGERRGGYTLEPWEMAATS